MVDIKVSDYHIRNCIAEFDFDVARAVTLAPGQLYPEELVVSFPRERVTDDSGVAWAVYSHRGLPDVQVLWAESTSRLRVLHLEGGVQQDEHFSVVTLEELLRFRQRLEALEQRDDQGISTGTARGRVE